MKLKQKPLSAIDKYLIDYKLHLADDHIVELFKKYSLSRFLVCATNMFTNLELGRNTRLCLTALEGCLYNKIDRDEIRRILVSLLFYKKSSDIMLFVNKAVLKLDNDKDRQGFDPESFIKLNRFVAFIKNKNNNIKPGTIEKTIIFESIRMQSLLFIQEFVIKIKEEYLKHCDHNRYPNRLVSFKIFINNYTYIRIINKTFTRWAKLKSLILNFPEQKRILNEAINNLKREMKHDHIS